jgi:L-fuconolactonase
MTVKIIDPHIHLFDLQEGEYQWLKLENEPYSDAKFF